MKNKKKYSLNVGANYNSSKDEWNLSLGLNVELEQEDDMSCLFEDSNERELLEEDTE